MKKKILENITLEKELLNKNTKIPHSWFLRTQYKSDIIFIGTAGYICRIPSGYASANRESFGNIICFEL